MVAKHFPHRIVYRAMDSLYRYTDLIFPRYIRHSGSSLVKSANDEAEVAVVVKGACAHGVSIDTGSQGSSPWWSVHPVSPTSSSEEKSSAASDGRSTISISSWGAGEDGAEVAGFF